MRRIFKSVGAKRVSKDACLLLKKYLEEECKRILKEAYELSKHDNRTTITKKDVKMVVK